MRQLEKKRWLLLITILVFVLAFLIDIVAVYAEDNIYPKDINLKIKEDEFVNKNITIINQFNRDVAVSLSITGNVSSYAFLSQENVRVKSLSNTTVTIKFMAMELGRFKGDLTLSGGLLDSAPIEFLVRSTESIPVNALFIEVAPVQTKINPGTDLKYKIDMQNLLSDKKYNVTLNYNITRVDNKSINDSIKYISFSNEVTIETAIPSVGVYPIPKSFPIGMYVFNIQADFLNLTSSTEFLFEIENPFWMREWKGIKVWQMILTGVSIILLIALVFLIRWWLEKRKRYHIDVDYKLLPKPGARSCKVGLISETKKEAFIELEALTTHSIVAGATGRGKSVAAQDIIEEALMKDVAIIAFDPTAQWSGMLRKCEAKKMLDLYPRFGLKKKDARGFNGNVRAITNSREIINVRDYIKPGEIQIFSINKLQPSEIDIVITNAIKNIFESNFQESQTLDVLLVFDEVHRLLPKFGSSGNGFIQIERACREFRKWGIGIMLVSQVLADFVGEIKANINTEVQLRTGDEGDLNRIKSKYGGGILKSLIKASVGTAMVQNSNYNRGKPYFVSFRPLLHSVRRLSDEELEQYNKYNEIIDDLTFQLEQLKEQGVDIFDKQLELKLALDKLKTGNFQMVDIYLESLKPSIEKSWEKLGSKPKKREIMTISEEDLATELNKARKAREAHEAKEGVKKESEHMEEKPAEAPKYEKIIPNALTLDNGAMISTLAELSDVLDTLDPETFALHVNDEKNDIAEWIKTEAGDEALATSIADKKTTQEIIDLLKEDKKKSEKKNEKKKKED